MKAETLDKLIADARAAQNRLPRLFLSENGDLYTTDKSGTMKLISKLEVMKAVSEARGLAANLYQDLTNVPRRGQGRDA